MDRTVLLTDLGGPEKYGVGCEVAVRGGELTLSREAVAYGERNRRRNQSTIASVAEDDELCSAAAQLITGIFACGNSVRRT